MSKLKRIAPTANEELKGNSGSTSFPFPIDPCFSKLIYTHKHVYFCDFFFWFVVFSWLFFLFHLSGEATLIRSVHFVKAAVARGRGGSLLLFLVVVLVVCFQERGEICASPRLLPPGKSSVAAGLARRRDAEDLDAQVGGDLEAHAGTVARQIQKREDLTDRRRGSNQ